MRTQLAWRVLDLAATAAECGTVEELRVQLLPALTGALGADLAIYHQMRTDGGVQEFGVHEPADEAIVHALANYPAVVEHSPLLQHFRATGRPGVVSLGQLLTARAWHENPVYRESHRLLGVEDHLALVLHLSGGRLHGLTFTRGRGTFDDDARELLSLLAPHIRAAVRRSLVAPVPYRVLSMSPSPTWTWRTGPAVGGADDTAHLTPREREVLALAVAGRTSHQVARLLDVSPRTVDKHLEHAFRKVGATCRQDAAARLEEAARSL